MGSSNAFLEDTKDLIRAAAVLLAPWWFELLIYILFMPRSPTPWTDLALHQQLISLTALPMLIWGAYRFATRMEEYKRTPEERVMEARE